MLDSSLAYESIFVARQPIFRTDLTVWGHELLFRSSDQESAIITDAAQATSSVIADGFSLASEGLPRTTRILINFPEKLLLSDIAFALPPDVCMIEVLENVPPTPAVLKALTRLKDAGYGIALDDFVGQPELLPFLEYADIVKIDILGMEGDLSKTDAVLDMLPDRGPLLLAEKVEDSNLLAPLGELGFSLFQGFFFSRPVIIPGRKLSSNEMTRLQLLEELGRSDFHLRRLTEILKADPNLSYRLFRYINSVSLGLRYKVTSLDRAVAFLGERQIRQWLHTAILADLNPAPKAGELASMSVQRAKFLESLCNTDALKSCQPDAMFTIGLFSLLDAMLDVKMDDILTTLPLDDEIADALTGRNPLHSLLGLASSYEKGLWRDTAEILRLLNLDMRQGDLLYARARHWAQKALGAGLGE